MANTQEKWEKNIEKKWLGAKIDQKLDFLKKIDFCDFWFFCVFRRAHGGLIFFPMKVL